MPVEKTTPKKPSPQKKAPRKGFFSGLWAYEDTKEEEQKPMCDDKNNLIEPKGCAFCQFGQGPKGNKKCVTWLTQSVAKEPHTLVLSDAQGKKRDLGGCSFILPDSGEISGTVYNANGDLVYKTKTLIIPMDGSQYNDSKPDPEPA